MPDDKYMEITDSDNNITKYRILECYTLRETGKKYIIYTDDSHNENNELNVYAAIYNPNGDGNLEKIESKQEWDIVKNQIKEFNLRRK